MKIVVCVKQVPNTMEVKIDPKTGTLIRDKAPAILNTFDEFAIEESVQIREKLGGEVVALTMGPPNAKEVLLDAYALGADLGVHVNDRAVRGSDTFATAGILAAAVKKIQDVDLVICGKQAIDGDTAQVGPEMAEILGLPHVACDSHYYSEERIYDGFITMVNKLRFSEDNILGQVISRLEMTLAAIKRNNLAARDLSKSIAELNAKLLMLEQLRSKGYLAPEVYQAQANEIGAELARLKDVRQEKFNSKAASMLEEVKKLKMLIFELEEPLETFDEKLFLEIVKSIQINKKDEMSVEFLGGLRFKERI